MARPCQRFMAVKRFIVLTRVFNETRLGNRGARRLMALRESGTAEHDRPRPPAPGCKAMLGELRAAVGALTSRSICTAACCGAHPSGMAPVEATRYRLGAPSGGGTVRRERDPHDAEAGWLRRGRHHACANDPALGSREERGRIIPVVQLMRDSAAGRGDDQQPRSAASPSYQSTGKRILRELVAKYGFADRVPK